jgi:hypothetical protein
MTYYVVVDKNGLSQACVTNRREAKSIARDLKDDLLWAEDSPFIVLEFDSFVEPLTSIQ